MAVGFLAISLVMGVLGASFICVSNDFGIVEGFALYAFLGFSALVMLMTTIVFSHRAPRLVDRA